MRKPLTPRDQLRRIRYNDLLLHRLRAALYVFGDLRKGQDMADPVDPREVVQRQLDAYNARDIERFMACWAQDAQVFAFPDELLADGAAEIRARHVIRFQEPNLFGLLLARVSVGSLVIDHETVTRTFPEGPGRVDVIAIYEVADGRIALAWFRMGAPEIGSA
jgi:hypothetical protein